MSITDSVSAAVTSTRETSSSTGYRRGYTTSAHLRKAIKEAHRTKLWLTSTIALVDHMSVPVLAIASAASSLVLPLSVAVLIMALASIVISRQLRGLENLVHEASHFNWSRHRRVLNDVLAVALAATPPGVRIRDYRESHLRHHGRFGTEGDPDRERYEELDLEALNRRSLSKYMRDIVVRFWAYQRGWYASMGTDPLLVVVLPLAWAAVFVALPALLVLGVPHGLLAIAVWLVGYAIVLPVLRFIAESSEHIYSDSNTVFDATITNIGRFQRLVIHPHNDGYHTVHHMWPGIPHHQLARLHRLLLAEDPDGYGRRLRYRTGVLQDPVRGVVER